MPKQYYAYIPFLPGAGATELESAVRRWQNNVSSILSINENLEKSILLKRGLIERESAKGSAKDTDSIRGWEAGIRDLEREKESGPVLHSGKSPILIKHGVKRLDILSGVNRDEYVLYIVGHCAPGSTTIRETQSIRTSPDKLDAAHLLDRMASDGLPKDILNIKLLSCFGAADYQTEDVVQKSFADSFWKALRGYCSSLVRMTAYTEAVLITSFYENTAAPQKAFAKIKLGEVLDPRTVKPAGRLSSVSKKYVARPCTICGKPVQVRCSGCGLEFCTQSCSVQHLDEKRFCKTFA